MFEHDGSCFLILHDLVLRDCLKIMDRRSSTELGPSLCHHTAGLLGSSLPHITHKHKTECFVV
jgi:hypothetical protein